MKQFRSNDLEISPRSSTVASRESCRVAMYVKCSEDSERKKRKSPFSTTPFSIDAPPPANPREYLHKPYTARNYVPWAIFLLLAVYGYSSANFRIVLSESRTAGDANHRAGGRTLRTPGRGVGASRCSGASCYVWKIFFSSFLMFSKYF